MTLQYTHKEEMEMIYEYKDDYRTQTDYKTNRQQPLRSTGSERVMMRRYRSVTVCLVLLCVLLLTAVIVLCVLINTNNQQCHIKTKNITEERDQLLAKYTNITEERDQLLTKYTNLTEEKDQLLTNNTKFKKEIGQLLTNNTNLKKERDQLLTDNSNLKKEREQLLLKSKNMATENERLSTNNHNLNKQRDQLTQQKNTMMEILKADGWKEYQSSLYFISSEKKSWSESRRYCREKAADLIIINNKEEQDLFKTVSGTEYIWIGLTDIDQEGRWKWVDGSALSYSFRFWRSREPNGGRDENCVETHSSGWNDFYCNKALKWSCEKKLF